MELRPETKIIDLLMQIPSAMGVLSRHGMHCMGCLGVGSETISDSCKMHSIDMLTLLAELQEVNETKDLNQ